MTPQLTLMLKCTGDKKMLLQNTLFVSIYKAYFGEKKLFLTKYKHYRMDYLEELKFDSWWEQFFAVLLLTSQLNSGLPWSHSPENQRVNTKK
jgi:hypothetical protein